MSLSPERCLHWILYSGTELNYLIDLSVSCVIVRRSSWTDAEEARSECLTKIKASINLGPCDFRIQWGNNASCRKRAETTVVRPHGRRRRVTGWALLWIPPSSILLSIDEENTIIILLRPVFFLSLAPAKAEAPEKPPWPCQTGENTTFIYSGLLLGLPLYPLPRKKETRGGRESQVAQFLHW